jgi:hypothetical protein
VQNREDNLGDHVFGCNKVDVMHSAYVQVRSEAHPQFVTLTCLLQLDVPLGQLFRCEVEAVALVSDIMVLAKHTADTNQ